MKTNILDLTLPEFEAAASPPYRARQIFRWIYGKHCFDFAKMTDLPADLAGGLAEIYNPMPAQVIETSSNADDERTDGAEKFLIEFSDGARVETALIYSGGRATVCLSTQAGCPVGCLFCASGADGLERNLTSGEIMAQALLAGAYLSRHGQEITNYVIMGMGEPLLNYENTLRFIRTATAPWGLGVSARRITLSTVGIVKAVRRLAKEDLKINLAISLHAPNDEIRARIVPRNEGVGQILAAAREYFKATGREVTFEYVLITGINSDKEHAIALARRLANLQCTVNLIALNPSEGLPAHMRAPTIRSIEEFKKTLKRLGVKTTLRKSKGGPIQAACGQLKARRG